VTNYDEDTDGWLHRCEALVWRSTQMYGGFQKRHFTSGYDLPA
jgi:hypothetical protein